MFESLSDKLQDVFKKLRGQGKITEENISEALREVRRALLEADVSLAVVKEFVSKVKEKALGVEVMQGLNPGQQFIKIVNDELVELLGGERAPLAEAHPGPTVILMAGLQGSGKTTTSGKLALYLRKKGRNPLLVACDVYRPAAMKQLEVLGKQINIPVFLQEGSTDPVAIATEAIQFAKTNGKDYVIVDTAGRLHVDEAMMDEIRRLKAALHPQEILLVVDAMTGQDAVKIAESFHQALDITGVVLTKLDGDTRGGAALSVKQVTGRPIKFAGAGEKLDALEPFHPDRIATRILGMGDVLTLIERAQETLDENEAKRLEQKFRKAEFDLEDFVAQMRQVKKLGSMSQIFEMLPIGKMLGVDISKEQLAEGEVQLKRIETIINSMTAKERRNPKMIDMSRKRRIANGSGTSIPEVNKLLKDFENMRAMMKQFGKFEKQMGKRMPKMPPGMGGNFPGNFPFGPKR
ncbi:MAG TPA: signal recognition particle protein [Stenomitos sp.]